MRTRNKFLLTVVVQRNASPFQSGFGYMRGTVRIVGDIVSPDPQLWDCELGIAYHDENGNAFGYDDQQIAMEEAIKNAR